MDRHKIESDITKYLIDNNATIADATWLSDWLEWQVIKWRRYIPKETDFRDALNLNSDGQRISDEDLKSHL